MSDRSQEIEAFYWVLIRVGVMAFGYLMMIGGGLMAISYLLEKVRTGAVAFGGEAHADPMTAAQLIVIPGLIAIAGYVAVRKMRQWRAGSARS